MKGPIPFARFLACAGAALVVLAPATHAQAPPAPDTLGHVVPMPVVEVSTSRTSERASVAVSRLRRDAIRALDWGQDTPMALATQPGAYAYSDAGNGVGYSYLTLDRKSVV